MREQYGASTTMIFAITPIYFVYTVRSARLALSAVLRQLRKRGTTMNRALPHWRLPRCRACLPRTSIRRRP